ncbi:MAG: hypothetical protein AAF806_31440, partial [Bacteroidota bacterium]
CETFAFPYIATKVHQIFTKRLRSTEMSVLQWWGSNLRASGTDIPLSSDFSSWTNCFLSVATVVINYFLLSLIISAFLC